MLHPSVVRNSDCEYTARGLMLNTILSHGGDRRRNSFMRAETEERENTKSHNIINSYLLYCVSRISHHNQFHMLIISSDHVNRQLSVI